MRALTGAFLTQVPVYIDKVVYQDVIVEVEKVVKTEVPVQVEVVRIVDREVLVEVVKEVTCVCPARVVCVAVFAPICLNLPQSTKHWRIDVAGFTHAMPIHVGPSGPSG